MEIDNRRMEDSTSALTGTKTPAESKMDNPAMNGSSKSRDKVLTTDPACERPNRFTTTSRYVPLSERAGSGLSSGYGSQDSLEKRSTLSSSNSSVGSSSGSSREVILQWTVFPYCFSICLINKY